MDDATLKAIEALVRTQRRWPVLARRDAVQTVVERFCRWERKRLWEGKPPRMRPKRLRVFVKGCLADAVAVERRHWQTRNVNLVERNGVLRREVRWRDRRVIEPRDDVGEAEADTPTWEKIIAPGDLEARAMLQEALAHVSEEDHALLAARCQDEAPRASARTRQRGLSPALTRQQVHKRLRALRQQIDPFLPGGLANAATHARKHAGRTD